MERQGTCWVVVVRRGERLERSHESITWFWRCGVAPGGVYVMLVAGFGQSPALGSLSLCVHGVCGVGLWASQSAVGPCVRACYGGYRLGGARASAAAAECGSSERQCTASSSGRGPLFSLSLVE